MKQGIGPYLLATNPLPAIQSDLPLAAQGEVAAVRLLAKTDIKSIKLPSLRAGSHAPCHSFGTGRLGLRGKERARSS